MAAAAAAISKIERAHQMYRDGQHREALGFYTEALSMAKTKAQKIALHSNRAACYLKLHDFKKAAEECTSVLELDQQHTGALMLRAQTLVTLKEYQSALFDVNRLMELNPSSDVYKNLQVRLKSQLSLAPIPECEEESLILEEEEENEDDEELEDGGDNDHDHEFSSEEYMDRTIDSTSGKNKVSLVQTCNAEVVDKKIESQKDKIEPTVPQAKDLDKKIEPGGETKDTVLQLRNAEEDVTKKIELQKTKTPVVQMENVRDSANAHPKGWETIPKPKGHSGLDYSRWDRVEDDSSEDEEDEDEELQPRYRFRVRTVGVRPVK